VLDYFQLGFTDCSPDLCSLMALIVIEMTAVTQRMREEVWKFGNSFFLCLPIVKTVSYALIAYLAA
jgi:hypothetical protein